MAHGTKQKSNCFNIVISNLDKKILKNFIL